MIEVVVVMIATSVSASAVYLAVKLSMRSIEKLESQFRILGEKLGVQAHIPRSRFSLFKKFPKLEGSVDGKAFSMYMYIVGSGKNQRVYTAFTLEAYNRYSYTLKIWREGFFSKIGKKLGLQDIKVGDDAFDKEFIFRSNDDYFVRELFSESLKSHLMQVRKHLKGQFHLKQDEIKYSEMITITKPVQRESFEQLIYFASALSEQVKHFSEAQKPEGL